MARGGRDLRRLPAAALRRRARDRGRHPGRRTDQVRQRRQPPGDDRRHPVPVRSPGPACTPAPSTRSASTTRPGRGGDRAAAGPGRDDPARCRRHRAASAQRHAGGAHERPVDTRPGRADGEDNGGHADRPLRLGLRRRRTTPCNGQSPVEPDLRQGLHGPGEGDRVRRSGQPHERDHEHLRGRGPGSAAVDRRQGARADTRRPPGPLSQAAAYASGLRQPEPRGEARRHHPEGRSEAAAPTR